MRVPRDQLAELAVVGSACWAACPELAEVVSAEDFHDRRLAKMYARLCDDVAASGPEVPALPSAWMAWVFPRHAAALAALGGSTPGDVAADEELIERCLERAASGVAQTVEMGRRVADAARRRELMVVLSDAYNALGTGSSLSEVTERLAGV